MSLPRAPGPAGLGPGQVVLHWHPERQPEPGDALKKSFPSC